MHKRLLEVAIELQRSAQVVVTHFHVPEADPAEVRRVLGALPHGLNEAITGFYGACGGFQLQWTHRRNPRFEECSTVGDNSALPHDAELDGYRARDGCIMIGSMAEVFLTDQVEAMYAGAPPESRRQAQERLAEMSLQFAGKAYTHLDFMRRTKVLDLFRKENDMAFFLDGTPDPPLMLGMDHQACYTDSRLTGFACYLDFLCRTKGAIQARMEWYAHEDGHALPRLSTRDHQRVRGTDLAQYDPSTGPLFAVDPD